MVCFQMECICYDVTKDENIRKNNAVDSRYYQSRLMRILRDGVTTVTPGDHYYL
jgi:hypothetical protein